MAETKLALETVKLLLQVAWADHDVSEEEVEFVLTYARKSGIAEGDLAEIRDALAGERALPPPDLSLLREHRFDVLTQVRELIAIDDNVDDEELDTLQTIEDMLE